MVRGTGRYVCNRYQRKLRSLRWESTHLRGTGRFPSDSTGEQTCLLPLRMPGPTHEALVAYFQGCLLDLYRPVQAAACANTAVFPLLALPSLTALTSIFLQDGEGGYINPDASFIMYLGATIHLFFVLEVCVSQTAPNIMAKVSLRLLMLFMSISLGVSDGQIDSNPVKPGICGHLRLRQGGEDSRSQASICQLARCLDPVINANRPSRRDGGQGLQVRCV